MEEKDEINDLKKSTKSTSYPSQELQLPWVEKYRPKSLSELIAHEDIISIISNLIDNDNLPHLLLYGPPGTGKTSTIIAAAKRMYGSSKAYSSMALELNASDARGIDVVRNEIKEFAGTRQLFNKGIKLIILDEADAMTSDAQFALRRVIEKYTKNARFCLICNYVSKIIPALQSRCTKFRFAPLSREQIRSRLVDIAEKESVELTENAIHAILSLSGGDMRRVLNLLQAAAMSSSSKSNSSSRKNIESSMDMDIDDFNSNVIDEKDIYLTSGAPLPDDMTTILDLLFNHPFHHAYMQITNMCKTKGYALVDVLQDLTTMITSMENLPSGVLADLLDAMSNVEYRLAFGTDEKIQTACLVGSFILARNKITVIKA